MKNIGFWDMMPCSLIKSQPLGER